MCASHLCCQNGLRFLGDSIILPHLRINQPQTMYNALRLAVEKSHLLVDWLSSNPCCSMVNSIHIVQVAERGERERGGKFIWKNNGWMMPELVEENRQAAQKIFKEDESKYTHSKTCYHWIIRNYRQRENLESSKRKSTPYVQGTMGTFFSSNFAGQQGLARYIQKAEEKTKGNHLLKTFCLAKLFFWIEGEI